PSGGQYANIPGYVGLPGSGGGMAYSSTSPLTVGGNGSNGTEWSITPARGGGGGGGGGGNGGSNGYATGGAGGCFGGGGGMGGYYEGAGGSGCGGLLVLTSGS